MQTSSTPPANPPFPEADPVVNRWIVWLARLGYAAKGLIFLVLGWLALEQTFTLGGKATDPVGALREIGQPPYGTLPLSMMMIGLVSYAVWQLIRAVVDLEGQGRSLQGLRRRTSYFFMGVLHGGLAYSAFRLLVGVPIGSSEQQTELWTASVLVQPFGAWLVGLAGLSVGLVGLYQFYNAYQGLFLQELQLAAMSQRARQWATQSGRLGHVVLGGVLLLIGGFLLQAAVQLDPTAAGGWRAALQMLARPGPTPWLLGLVALGLVAYGLFTLILARYARCFFMACARPA